MTYWLAVSAVLCVVLAAGIITFWATRTPNQEREPSTYPTCYGDYPKYSSHLLAERECWGCVFNEQCKQRTRYE